MSKERTNARVLFYQWVGLGLIIVMLWLDEILDLPRLIGLAEATPINWGESFMETVLVLVLGVFLTGLTLRLFRRVKHLEGQVRICGFCHQVQDGEKWVSFEDYLKSHSDAELAYGLNPCPKCSAQRFPVNP